MVDQLLYGIDRPQLTRLASRWYGDVRHASGCNAFSLYSKLASMVVEELLLAGPSIRPDALRAYDPPVCWQAALFLGVLLYTPQTFDVLCRDASLQVAELVASMTPDKRLAGPRQRVVQHAAVRDFSSAAKLLCLLHLQQQAAIFHKVLQATLRVDPAIVDDMEIFCEDALLTIGAICSVQGTLTLPLPALVDRSTASVKNLIAAVKAKKKDEHTKCGT